MLAFLKYEKPGSPNGVHQWLALYLDESLMGEAYHMIFSWTKGSGAYIPATTGPFPGSPGPMHLVTLNTASPDKLDAVFNFYSTAVVLHGLNSFRGLPAYIS